MADRRMFAKSVVESAKFLKMPATSQCLYFHLGMHADDDGVVEAYPIMNMVKANEDDLRVLVTKEFVSVLNEDMVSYIKDWQVNNKIRSDRKSNSRYRDLLLKVEPGVKLLEPTERSDLKGKKSKKLDGPRTVHGRPAESAWTAQYSVVEGSIGKDSIGECSAVPDTHTISYTLGSESLTEAEYQDLVKAFTKPVVDSVINRILNKPYRGCLNPATIQSWCKERSNGHYEREKSDSPELGEFLTRLSKERVCANG